METKQLEISDEQTTASLPKPDSKLEEDSRSDYSGPSYASRRVTRLHMLSCASAIRVPRQDSFPRRFQGRCNRCIRDANKHSLDSVTKLICELYPLHRVAITYRAGLKEYCGS